MNKVLVNFAHPAQDRSKMNKALLAGLEGLDGITINDLYAQYPDFLIDVAREQMLCETHQIILLVFHAINYERMAGFGLAAWMGLWFRGQGTSRKVVSPGHNCRRG